MKFKNKKVKALFEEEDFTEQELIPLFRGGKPVKSRLYENTSYTLLRGRIQIIETR